MELGGILAGIAVGAGKADGQPPVDHPPLGVQHLAEHQFMRGEVGEEFSTERVENPVAHCEAPASGHPDNADGGGVAPCGDGGDDVHSDQLLFHQVVGEALASALRLLLAHKTVTPGLEKGLCGLGGVDAHPLRRVQPL